MSFMLYTSLLIQVAEQGSVCEQLSASKEPDVVKSLVEGIDIEATHSAKCLQDACRHLLPIMKLAVTKMHPLLSDHSGN